MIHLNPRITNALKILHERLMEYQITWVLVGSTALALHGVDIEPQDIDVLTNKEDAFKMNSLLKDYETNPVTYNHSKRIKSFLGKFQINGIDLDIMGCPKVSMNGEWISLYEKLSTREFLQVEDICLPVYPLKDQITFYDLLRRKKDAIKIQKIQEKIMSLLSSTRVAS